MGNGLFLCFLSARLLWSGFLNLFLGLFFSLLELFLKMLDLLLLVLDGLEQLVQLLVLDGGRILLLNTLEEVREDVHIVDEGIVC